MKLSQLLGLRFKDTPAECSIASHALTVRGGYIKPVASGIFSLFLPMRRITHKIEAIIRREMDAIDGQEVLFPVVMPASLWDESGRYTAVGRELMRITDRNDNPMVLGMTHEEAAVHLARDTAQSYAQYPFMIYQLQTKFRDEPRARGGLIRVREFTMKDAYSFHTTWEDLSAYYKEAHRAYERVFARAGLDRVVSVESDNGMMGGKLSHEFMLLCDIGEDSIVLCQACGYRANLEVAACSYPAQPQPDCLPLEKVATPGQETIEDIANFFKIPATQTAKAVVYQRNDNDALVVCFLRGDLEVNETKLRNAVGCELHPAEREGELAYGSIGPIGITDKAQVFVDESLRGLNNIVCGANEEGFHYTGVCMERDLAAAKFGDYAKLTTGAPCPHCGVPGVEVSRGVEVGNIFQLGTKYTETMGMRYQDENGQLQTPIMGCYGIGVGRLAASVCEVCRDDYGPIWPMSIAPWQVHICALRAQEPAVQQAAAELYNQLTDMGVEVILDDRAVSAGYMFSDADLLGVPLRLVVSPKTLERGCVEMVARDKSFKADLPLAEAAGLAKGKVGEMLAAIDGAADQL